ncbi:hypothetical protein J4G43_047125 [Bradyrhizobium barranii subsp. barranii]|uniref:Uncharacterized protein n=1 Tax=Bradyrhizobium barranii subsp. barranii TaxID=2823807 RepID=A0A939MLY4_9BRAD|nr:hypothetical protein [Bradyrhizobium barranii]UEM11940.1 hypothetical protein J4G43_047125 [Bradyrhizobium barranii subsp. barranii]
MGNAIVRTVEAPEHGAFETGTCGGFPTYKPDSKFAKCNDKQMSGTSLFYKSSDGYVGPDSFKVLIIYPNLLAYKMIVR